MRVALRCVALCTGCWVGLGSSVTGSWVGLLADSDDEQVVQPTAGIHTVLAQSFTLLEREGNQAGV